MQCRLVEIALHSNSFALLRNAHPAQQVDVARITALFTAEARGAGSDQCNARLSGCHQTLARVLAI